MIVRGDGTEVVEGFKWGVVISIVVRVDAPLIVNTLNVARHRMVVFGCRGHERKTKVRRARGWLVVKSPTPKKLFVQSL